MGNTPWSNETERADWYKRQYESLQKSREWIPVAERLPATYETVLTAHDHGGIGYSYRSEKTWLCAVNEEEHQTMVLAWMPLPESYWIETLQKEEDKSINTF